MNFREFLNEGSADVDVLLQKELKNNKIKFKPDYGSSSTSYVIGDIEIENDSDNIVVRQGGKDVKTFTNPSKDYKKAVKKVQDLLGVK